MPVSALPGEYSCGSFGRGAYDFIDFLAKAGFSWWQVLPFCVPDSYRSPYMSPASFAGDVAYLDLDMLSREGLLSSSELQSARQRISYACEIERLGDERRAILKKAAERVSDRRTIDSFFAERKTLAKHCDFLAKRDGGGEDERFYHRFTQYHFYRQWSLLKEYANQRGISILGDLPFYVSADSADTEAAPEAFDPSGVAGVPPDYFSEDGQFWGNPLYQWDEMKKDGFSWWSERLAHTLCLFDGVRLDHFRAIAEYWHIPKGSRSAKDGSWKKGPGMALIRTLQKVAEGKLLVAENLGIIDEKVEKLLRQSRLPGMAVFQFGFDGNPCNPHLPHNYTENTVAYTGTHDNNTLLGFIWEQEDTLRREILSYIGFEGSDWDRCYECILRVMMRSRASLVIFPIQDLMGYGSDTRFNTPGKADGNWTFRISAEALAGLDAEHFRRMNEMYGRVKK